MNKVNLSVVTHAISIGLLVFLAGLFSPVHAQQSTDNNASLTDPDFLDQIGDQLSPAAREVFTSTLNTKDLPLKLAQLSADQINQFVSIMTDAKLLEALVAMGDPGRIQQWLDIMGNPAVISGAFSSLEQTQVSQWLSTMTNPAMMNQLLESVDQNYFNQWVGALTEPEVLDQMMRVMEPSMVMTMLGNAIPIMKQQSSADQ